jgi:hypothetical protein
LDFVPGSGSKPLLHTFLLGLCVYRCRCSIYFIYIYIYTYIYIYIHTHTHIYMYICICMCECICVHLCEWSPPLVCSSVFNFTSDLCAFVCVRLPPLVCSKNLCARRCACRASHAHAHVRCFEVTVLAHFSFPSRFFIYPTTSTTHVRCFEVTVLTHFSFSSRFFIYPTASTTHVRCFEVTYSSGKREVLYTYNCEDNGDFKCSDVRFFFIFILNAAM